MASSICCDEQEIVARFAELLENGADVPGSPAAVQLDHQMHKYHDVRSWGHHDCTRSSMSGQA